MSICVPFSLTSLIALLAGVEVPTACLESLLLSEEDHEFHEFPRVVEGNVLMSEEEQVAEEGKEGESGGGSGGRGRVPIADGPIVPTTPTPLRAPSARVLSAFVEDAKEYWRAKENDKKGSKAKVEDEHPAKRQRVGSESHVEEPMIRVPCPACMYDLSGPGESETKEKDDKKGKQKPRGDANMDKKKVGGDSPATGGASKGEKKLPASSSPTVPVHGVGGGNLHPAVIMSTIQLKKGWKNDARASCTCSLSFFLPISAPSHLNPSSSLSQPPCSRQNRRIYPMYWLLIARCA